VILLWRRCSPCDLPRASQGAVLGRGAKPLENGDFDAAAEVCQAEERALPNWPWPPSKTRVERTAAPAVGRRTYASERLRRSGIPTQLGRHVIKSGPLLGLFGTVLGMMAAFGRIGSGEKIKAEQIALDISIALICTAMGLMTAIPFTYLLANLSIRVRNLQDSLSSGMTRFLEHFKTVTAKYL